MATMTAPALTGRAKTIACYAKAFDRAVAARLVCFHDRTEDTYAVPSTSNPGEYHTVRHMGGSDWANLSCSCKATAVCLHMATVAYARKNHISAVKPEVSRCDGCPTELCPGDCPDAPKPEPEYNDALAHSDTNPCEHRWEGRDGGSEYRCRLCGAWCSVEHLNRDFELAAAYGMPDPLVVDPLDDSPEIDRTCPHGKPEFGYCDSCYLDTCREERLGAYALQDALLSGETAEEPPFAVQEAGFDAQHDQVEDYCHLRQVALGRRLSSAGSLGH